MSTDSGSPIRRRKPFVLDLPRIVGLTIRRSELRAPKFEHLKSSLPRHTQAAEFLVETDGPVPARGYGPALFVGDVEINQSERVGDTTWRFLAFEPDRLEPGAPISWGWMKDPPDSRRRTEFRYEIEGGPAASS